jgi:hypothetical protein
MHNIYLMSNKTVSLRYDDILPEINIYITLDSPEMNMLSVGIGGYKSFSRKFLGECLVKLTATPMEFDFIRSCLEKDINEKINIMFN